MLPILAEASAWRIVQEEVPNIFLGVAGQQQGAEPLIQPDTALVMQAGIVILCHEGAAGLRLGALDIGTEKTADR